METSQDPVEISRAFIISGHPLFAEAIARLLEDAGVEVAGRANGLERAQSRLKELAVEAIIVD